MTALQSPRCSLVVLDGGISAKANQQLGTLQLALVCSNVQRCAALQVPFIYIAPFSQQVAQALLLISCHCTVHSAADM